MARKFPTPLPERSSREAERRVHEALGAHFARAYFAVIARAAILARFGLTRPEELAP